MSDIKIRPVGYALGAELSGIDLSRPLSTADFETIKRALQQHLMLCFPGQQLSRDNIVDFASRFGPVDDNSTVKHRDPENPRVTMLSSKPFAGKPWDTFKNGDHWHSDRSFRPDPTAYTLLYAVEMPDVGGNTMFANQYMSYETISPKLQAFLEQLETVHLQTRKASAMMAKQFPAVVHPLIRVHPDTGRKALYLGEHARGFVGMTEEESQPLLDYLTAHATRPEFVYRHAWHVNDFVMWDNRCLMHIAVRDYDMSPGGPARHLLKCSVQGESIGRWYETVTGHKYDLEIAERSGVSQDQAAAVVGASSS
ncbi:TauD/TfdA family dioxygenase [Amycolatopsis sp. K13G38]|uniref:TauD/TfdA family dioxygenase n=1 Tax=Amycolatopsis acididurans TaxID=2724524 RepID=A0ABX1JBX4_9PSEU|nr:TauD/TfdA family dioxygenase [Amycolatopsis acididurans]NKQ56105.1 TauD/TfdA family dioxygenase [Amycolatopsis acididurans]